MQKTFACAVAKSTLSRQQPLPAVQIKFGIRVSLNFRREQIAGFAKGHFVALRRNSFKRRKGKSKVQNAKKQ